MIIVEVKGTQPSQTGSKRAFVVGKRAIITDANKKYKVWRKAVEAAILSQHGKKNIIHGPVEVQVEFRFDRPAGHYGSGKNASKVKASAEIHHIVPPDIDKLARNTIDALTGLVINDDSQIVVLRCSKVYTSYRGECGATISITEDVNYGNMPEM